MSRRIWSGLVVSVLVLVAATTGVQFAAAAPATGWAPPAVSPPVYPDVHIDWDVPITMSDGTVLKANVYRPIDEHGNVVTEPLPTLVNLTPYTKLVSMTVDSAQSVPVLADAIADLAGRFDLTGTGISG